MVELGISTFGETTELEGTGQTYSHAERIRQLVAEIELADKVGLDVYGIGEHHRADFAVSAPECHYRCFVKWTSGNYGWKRFFHRIFSLVWI